MEIKELWKKVPGYQHVEVSSLGKIKKLAYGKKTISTIQSKFTKDKDGYCKCFVMREDGVQVQRYVHQLVALAFIQNPDKKPHVNHIDNNRQNNAVTNLEQVTPRENVLHSYKFGNRKKCKQVPRNTLLTDFQISQIDTLRTIYTVNQISKLFNIGYQSLKNIIHKKKQCERLDDQQPSNYNSIYN